MDTPDFAPSLWTADDVCAIYARLLTMGWLDPELATPRTMEMYAVKLGHYVRLARREREQRMAAARRREVCGAFVEQMLSDLNRVNAALYGGK